MKIIARLFYNRNLRILTVADAVSVVGDQIGWVALLWFATVTTNHPGTVGFVGLAYGLPSVLLGPVVGNILDRVSHKTVLFTANVGLGVSYFAIPILYALHDLNRTTLLLIVLVAGCITPFTTVGWMVIVPNLVHEDDLGAANSVVESVWHSASLLGPLVGGWLIARYASPTAIFADGISFWIAAVCVLLLRMEPSPCLPSRTSAAEAPREDGFWHSTWDGLKLLFGLKPVWWITVGAIIFTFAFGQLEVSLLLFTHRELALSALVLGTFWTTYFVASLVGSAISGVLSRKGKSGVWMSVMAIAWGICFIPWIWVHPIEMAYVSMALGGLLFAGYPPLARTSVQRLVPQAYHGRIMGIRGSLIAVGMPIGAYLGGTLSNWIPASLVIGYTGVIVTMTGLVLFSVRAFRTI